MVYFESFEKHFVNYGYSHHAILAFFTSQNFDVYKFCNLATIQRVKKDNYPLELINLLAVNRIYEKEVFSIFKPVSIQV